MKEIEAFKKAVLLSPSSRLHEIASQITFGVIDIMSN
jgi:hypothetical protein